MQRRKMACIVGKGVMGEEVVSWVVEEGLPEAWTLMVRRGQAGGRVSEVTPPGEERTRSVWEARVAHSALTILNFTCVTARG